MLRFSGRWIIGGILFLFGSTARTRFLRARKFDVVKAKEMLLSCEQWRKDFKVDEIVKCAQPVIPRHRSTADECTQELRF